MKIKIMTVVGTRPNFMKAAPIIAAIQAHNDDSNHDSSDDPNGPLHVVFQHILVHTGQHYDDLMSDSFFVDLNLPKPDYHLGVGGGSHATQTAAIMKKFEEVLARETPDVVVVVGDVNSTLACALVASKISFDSNGTRPLIAHVEAGLRSFDRAMPEEINRILTDHIADMLFVTEESDLKNLTREGIPDERIHFVGNTMIDSLFACEEKAEASEILEQLGLRSQQSRKDSPVSAVPYALLTLHRPSNVDNRDAFFRILEGLDELASSVPIIFPSHPRTKKRIAEFHFEHFFSHLNEQQSPTGFVGSASTPIWLTEPLGYLDFLCLMKHATLVITDSRGIQEETTCLGIPCVTIRENTERPITLKMGNNYLAGVTKECIRAAIRRQQKRVGAECLPEKWDGKSAGRILRVIQYVVGNVSMTKSQELPSEVLRK